MRLAKLIVAVLAAFLFVGSANATSANTDVSDLWWNPNESGWGMQLVNTGVYVYATIYVYGSDGKPIWFAAGLDKIGAGVPATFTGKLYAATGPYFGAPASPNFVRQVGTMTFVLTSVSTGQLSYSVDGVPVNKLVQRQPLTLDYYGGFYKAYLTYTATGCVASLPVTVPVDITVVQNGTQMSQTWAFGNFTCTNSGTYSQQGRMGTYNSVFSCNVGSIGTMVLFQMTNEPYTFMARYHEEIANGCIEDGEIVGLTPR